MEGNKDEGAKCIEYAQKYLLDGNKEKAIKFLIKADKLYPSKKAKALLAEIQAMDGGAASGANDDADGASASNGTYDGSARHRKPQGHAAQPSPERDVPKEYTNEQIQSVRKIRKCKDYYEILGLSKDCTEDDLKKAYKKLALKFHPDKNRAPGATEAFKAISNAFAVLSEPEKRKRYDQFGSEDEIQQRRHSHGGHYEYDYTRGGFEGDISAEELFNMFFGGGFTTVGGHSRRVYRQRTQTAGTAETSESSHAYLVQMAPLLFLVAISLLSVLFEADPYFSFSRTQKYSMERKTQNLGVPYFVKGDFSTEYKGSIRRLEQQIEDEYVSNLRSNCYRERSYKESMLWRARNFADAKLYERATNLKTPSCDTLTNLYNGG